MSWDAVRRVLESSRATGTTRLVLVVLAEHTNSLTGNCYPSVSLIAAEVNVGERAVQYAFKDLVDLGELEIELHGAPVGGRRQYRPNLYRVLLNDAGECSGDVLGGAPTDTTEGPVVHDGTSSGAPERRPVMHQRAPKSEKNQKEPLRCTLKPTDDAMKARAKALTLLAFEQRVKPALRGGAPAAVGIIKSLLEADIPDSAIEGAIRAGVEVWTTAGLQVAIAKARRTMRTISYDSPGVVYR